MLLTLALRLDPEFVYRIALERLTPDEIAEASRHHEAARSPRSSGESSRGTAAT
ncbi:MAG TPA: hypothetical protein VF129_00210 [Actinomycetota bacterium]